MSVVLSSWKEIAQFLGRGARTTQRWEQKAELPIHRLGEGSNPPVYAFPLEIEHWLQAKPAETKTCIHTTLNASAAPLRRTTLKKHRALRSEMRQLLQEQKNKLTAIRRTVEMLKDARGRK